MNYTDKPEVFPIPWGDSAGAGFIRPIPTVSQIGTEDGAASLTDGFPPLTFQPLGSGGVPPFGQDTNGILFRITAALQWAAAGGPFFWNSAFRTAIGGYPLYSMLNGIAVGTLWMSKVDNNTVNPDLTPTNWFSITGGRLLETQVFDSPGTYTYVAPFGAAKLRVRLVGGGGAGGGTPVTNSSQVAPGGGGGSGAGAEVWIPNNGNGEAIQVGAAGTPAVGAVGGAGGDSFFGVWANAPGGAGGSAGIPATPPVNGGGGAGGGLASTIGGQAIQLTGGTVGAVGVALSLFVGFSGQGASSGMFGAGGSPVSIGAGTTGTGWGAGGSGAIAYTSTAAQAGGAGRPGKVIVEAYSA